MITIYETAGKKYFADIWNARNDYIELLLENTEERAIKFFNKNALRILSPDELNTAYKLLEIQKYSMLMFTSCGWFFSEISGIETVKILEYASKAMELAREITNVSLEEEFLTRLSEAKSNLPEYGNGKEVYEKLVQTAHEN